MQQATTTSTKKLCIPGKAGKCASINVKYGTNNQRADSTVRTVSGSVEIAALENNNTDDDVIEEVDDVSITNVTSNTFFTTLKKGVVWKPKKWMLKAKK